MAAYEYFENEDDFEREFEDNNEQIEMDSYCENYDEEDYDEDDD